MSDFVRANGKQLFNKQDCVEFNLLEKLYTYKMQISDELVTLMCCYSIGNGLERVGENVDEVNTL